MEKRLTTKKGGTFLSAPGAKCPGSGTVYILSSAKRKRVRVSNENRIRDISVRTKI